MFQLVMNDECRNTAITDCVNIDLVPTSEKEERSTTYIIISSCWLNLSPPWSLLISLVSWKLSRQKMRKDEIFLRKHSRGLLTRVQFEFCPYTLLQYGASSSSVFTRDSLPLSHCEWGYTCCHSSPWVLPHTSDTKHTATSKQWHTAHQSVDTTQRPSSPYSWSFINYSALGFRCPLL